MSKKSLLKTRILATYIFWILASITSVFNIAFAGTLPDFNFQMVSRECSTKTSLDAYATDFSVPTLPPGNFHSFITFEEPLSKILAKEFAANGRIVVDCSLFVQLAAMAQNDLMAREKPRLFAMGTADPFILADYFKAEFAYISPRDGEIAEQMQNTHYISAGHWLLKVGPDQYLGLHTSGSGFATQSGQTWIQELRNSLAQEMAADQKQFDSCEGNLDMTDRFRRSSYHGVKSLLENGLLEDWKILEFKPGQL